MKINNKYYGRIFFHFILLLLLLLPISSHAEEVLSVNTVSNDATTDSTISDNKTETETSQESIDLFADAIELLKERSFKKKAQAVEQLQSFEDPRILKTFKYLLSGKLYYRKENKLIVYLDKSGEGYTASAVVVDDVLGKIEKSDFKKIIVNNKIRGQLRGAIANLSLGSKDAAIRLSAIKEMLSSPTSDMADLLRNIIDKESNADVHDAMATLIALTDINSDDKTIRLAAIKQLSGNLEPAAFNKLGELLEKNDDGTYLETDKDVVKAATTAINLIKDKRDFYGVLETVFFGLSLGSVLLLAAIGLAITFGVMGVINMAHGELIMLGAYTTYVIQQLMPNQIEYSLFVAIPAAFLVAGLFGVAIERGVIRFLYGRPLETLLATFGISLILQQMVRSIFGTLNLAVETPQWMSGALEINSAFTLTYNRLYIVIFSLMVFFALLATLKKTSLGLQVRAVSQNRSMAKAMGVKTEWVDALTFGLGSGVAGVAGVALSQLTNVGSNLGQAYIIDSFMVVVFGGVGNLWGTLVGAMSLGVVNKFIEPWSGAVMAKIIILVFIILFIQKKPRGLFPQKGRAAEN
jgi:urea transport system permease protein